MGKANRKFRPSVPNWAYLDRDGCWNYLDRNHYGTVRGSNIPNSLSVVVLKRLRGCPAKALGQYLMRGFEPHQLRL